jgi:hypothetical protein
MTEPGKARRFVAARAGRPPSSSGRPAGGFHKSSKRGPWQASLFELLMILDWRLPVDQRPAFTRTLAFPSPAGRGRVPRQGRERASSLAARPQTSLRTAFMRLPPCLSRFPRLPRPRQTLGIPETRNPIPPRFPIAGTRRVASRGVRAKRRRFGLAAAPTGTTPSPAPAGAPSPARGGGEGRWRRERKPGLSKPGLSKPGLSKPGLSKPGLRRKGGKPWVRQKNHPVQDHGDSLPIRGARRHGHPHSDSPLPRDFTDNFLLSGLALMRFYGNTEIRKIPGPRRRADDRALRGPDPARLSRSRKTP